VTPLDFDVALGSKRVQGLLEGLAAEVALELTARRYHGDVPSAYIAHVEALAYAVVEATLKGAAASTFEEWQGEQPTEGERMATVQETHGTRVQRQRYEHALRIECPTCTALVGEGCRPASLTLPHLSRIDAAKRRVAS